MPDESRLDDLLRQVPERPVAIDSMPATLVGADDRTLRRVALDPEARVALAAARDPGAKTRAATRLVRHGRRRWQRTAMVGGLALAAAAVLVVVSAAGLLSERGFMATPARPDPASGAGGAPIAYAMDVRVRGRQARRGTAGPPGTALELRPESTLDVVLRPESAIEGEPPRADLYAVGPAGKLRRAPGGALTRRDNGVLRFQLPAGTFLRDAEGRWTVHVLLGPKGEASTAAELAALGADRRFRAELVYRRSAAPR
ncbi:MAG: hypothetical protein ACFCGT_21180 [Sandaracinaceae bacterium]